MSRVINLVLDHQDVVGYKFRCECLSDAILIQVLFAPFLAAWIQQQAILEGGQLIPDHDVTFFVKKDSPSLEGLRFILWAVPSMDLHVAAETLALEDQYTGERTYGEDENAKIPHRDLNLIHIYYGRLLETGFTPDERLNDLEYIFRQAEIYMNQAGPITVQQSSI